MKKYKFIVDYKQDYSKPLGTIWGQEFITKGIDEIEAYQNLLDLTDETLEIDEIYILVDFGWQNIREFIY